MSAGTVWVLNALRSEPWYFTDEAEAVAAYEAAVARPGRECPLGGPMSARMHAAIAALRDLHEAQQLEVAIGEAFSRLRGTYA